MTATRVAALSALEPDSAIRVEIGGVAIAVVLDSNGVVHAIGDTCTHGDISLADGFVE
ncbi:Rieske 2Fe-2S domain-containing protein, partial [Microbacterium sp. Leaf351]